MYQYYLINYCCHELWVWLLIGQKFPNDFVHYILWGEEIIKELWKNPSHYSSFKRKSLPDPENNKNLNTL